jgi:hypothetical protein
MKPHLGFSNSSEPWLLNLLFDSAGPARRMLILPRGATLLTLSHLKFQGTTAQEVESPSEPVCSIRACPIGYHDKAGEEWDRRPEKPRPWTPTCPIPREKKETT